MPEASAKYKEEMDSLDLVECDLKPKAGKAQAHAPICRRWTREQDLKEIKLLEEWYSLTADEAEALWRRSTFEERNAWRERASAGGESRE